MYNINFNFQGGFKIQLLDHLERPVLDLTPTIQGSEFVSNDATYVMVIAEGDNYLLNIILEHKHIK